MTCPEFEAMVNDLAGDRLMDAAIRRRLIGHAEQCVNCADRLEQERVLNEYLAGLAETTENLEADPSLKTGLLAAFATLHPPQNRFALREAPPPRPDSRRWLVAAAAAIVVTVLGITTLYWRSSPTVETAENRDASVARTTATIAPSPTPVRTENEKKSAEPASEKPDRRSQPARRPRPANMRNVGAPTLASVASEETTTDYLPLTYMSDQTMLQSGVVVRVEIPRATLLAIGLPMNSQRGNSLVKADVVVGDDGVARAIRLVQ